ncbi:MAG TPA: vWA domain-containing protein [Nannocystis sp.]|jgi:hypothetical protein
MTFTSSTRLLVPLTLCLACGDSGGSADSLSATGGASTITSATMTASGTPTTGDGTMSAGESTAEISGAAGSQTNGDDSTTATGGATSTGETTGEATTESTAGATTTTTTTSETMTTATDTTGALVPEPCQVEETKINPIPPDVLLVLDKSGSMSMETWDHDANPQTPTVTRWYSLYGVVSSIVTKFDKTVNFGMKLYPFIDAGSYENEGACKVDPGVEVEIAPENAASVLALLPGADIDVLGGTPMETGLKEAFTYLQALPADKQRFALMVADGEISKTCQGEVFNEALGAVKNAYAKGIATYVVGIDVDPSTSAQLAALAEAGGKPNVNNPDGFYQTSSQIELQAALQQIVDDTLSCVIDVNPEPSEPDLFQVWIGADRIDAVTDCATEDGWVWTKPHIQIELCGAACLELKKQHQVEARYFCTAG